MGSDAQKKDTLDPLVWEALSGNVGNLNNATQLAKDEALVSAAMGGHTEVIETLVGAGANVNAFEGQALIVAMKEGRPKCITTLLEAGADPKLSSGEALRLAASRNNQKTVETIYLAGEPWAEFPHLALSACASLGDTEGVKYWLGRGANPDWNRGAALRWASTRENTLESLKMMVAKSTVKGLQICLSCSGEGSKRLLEPLIEKALSRRAQEKEARAMTADNPLLEP